MPVAVLLTTWGMGMAPPNFKVLFNVSFIVIGVIIASFGEIQFVMVGFLFQLGGILFEAIRLVMVQRLLSSAEFKMDPLVSLYYFAPVCAVMNGTVALFLEVPEMTMDNIYNAGVYTLLLNAMVAFALNIAVVFLVSSFTNQSAEREFVCNADETNRLAKPPPSFSLSVVSSRISFSSRFPHSGLTPL